LTFIAKIDKQFIMKTTHSLRQLLTLLPFLLLIKFVEAQTKADVFDGKTPITWLGLDYTQARFIGVPNDYGKPGEVTNERISDFYTRSWNYLFFDQPRKFDAARAAHRASVISKIEVT